jgi:hypothetical protein
MKKALLALVILFSMNVFAVSRLFKNDREGKSFYIKKRQLKLLSDIYSGNVRSELVDSFKQILDSYNPGNICAVNIVEQVKEVYKEKIPKGYLLPLRDNDLVDDVAYGILKQASDLKSFRKRPKKGNRLFDKLTEEEKKKALRAFTGFSKKLERGSCYTQEYKALYNELKSADKKLKRRKFKILIDFALSSKAITEDDYKKIEIARRSKVQEWRMGLADYLKKKLQIRNQYPINDTGIRSNFVAQKVKKQKISQRIKLYQSYDYIQIALMGDIINKLRRRLESNKIEIIVHFDDDGELVEEEVIELDPMERFRFSIKLLRKEMHELSINTFFEGRQPSYSDLIVAAYELGMVPAEEVDEVASFEEIWNPKKTFWEKAQFWVTSVLSVGAVLVPPPYGFIPTLALVAIQASTQSKKEPEYDHSLF